MYISFANRVCLYGTYMLHSSYPSNIIILYNKNSRSGAVKHIIFLVANAL